MLKGGSIPATCRGLQHGLMDQICHRVYTLQSLSRARGQFYKKGGGWSCYQGHVALTSMMWSSVEGSTRTCCMLLWLNTCPGLKGSRRGIATPFCCWSPLPTECTLPRLRMLAVSVWSSSVLSSKDRLSFSTQLSEEQRSSYCQKAICCDNKNVHSFLVLS